MSLTDQLLTATGFLTLTYFLFKVAKFIYTFFIRPSSLPRYHHGPSPPWALITGASDGIGLHLAHRLAAQNFSLILHGRNATKLSRVQFDLLKLYPQISIQTWVLDAKDPSSITDSALPGLLEGKNLTILINNVGRGGLATYAGEIDTLININVRFAAQLTAYLLPILTANSPALILNIGSSAELGSPWLSIYSGCKAFLTSWSKALAAQMRAEGHDVEVLCLKVSEVNTAGSPAVESLNVLGVGPFAKLCLDRVGCGIRCVSPYWVAAVRRGVVECLPENVKEGLLIQVMRGRKRGWEEKRAKLG